MRVDVLTCGFVLDVVIGLAGTWYLTKLQLIDFSFTFPAS